MPDHVPGDLPDTARGPGRPGGRGGWLFGPLPDLCFGCGLGYAALVALLLCVRPDMARLRPWLPLLILCTGVPHYGATLLRVYATPQARRRHARAAFLAGALPFTAFLGGLRWPVLGSLLITLYLSWSPWHYAAQSYGLTLLFLRRRGAAPAEGARRLLRASFVASCALVICAYHRAASGGGGDPLYAGGAAYRFVPLGLPEGPARLCVLLLLLVYAAALGGALQAMLRGASPRALGPALALLGTQAAWTLLPVAGSFAAPGGLPGGWAALAFIWIAVGHCVQYLWITLYHARAAGTGRGASLGFLGRAALLGAALWTLPALLFGALPGGVPFDLGLGLLIAAAVNLHHFVLDGAIWKLRDPRVAGVLLGAPAPPAARPRAGPPSPGTCALGLIGGLSIACWVTATWEREIGYRRAYAAGDAARVGRAARLLRVLGQDGPHVHAALGRLLLRRGEAEAALAEFRRSLALQPTAAAWAGVARLHELRGEWAAARDACLAALALDPGHAPATRGLARAEQRLGHARQVIEPAPGPP